MTVLRRAADQQKLSEGAQTRTLLSQTDSLGEHASSARDNCLLHLPNFTSRYRIIFRCSYCVRIRNVHLSSTWTPPLHVPVVDVLVLPVGRRAAIGLAVFVEQSLLNQHLLMTRLINKNSLNTRSGYSLTADQCCQAHLWSQAPFAGIRVPLHDHPLDLCHHAMVTCGYHCCGHQRHRCTKTNWSMTPSLIDNLDRAEAEPSVMGDR